MAIAIVTSKLREIDEERKRERLQRERNDKTNQISEGRYARAYEMRRKDSATIEVLYENGLEAILEKAQEKLIERRLFELADSAPQL